MKKFLYNLATICILTAALLGCSKDDETSPTPTPTPAQASDVVDLGLTSGTLWAKANLGTTSETEAGNLYAWGEVATKSTFSASNYFDASNNKVTSSIIGTGYDAARAALGDSWQMPSKAQFEELFKECTVTRESNALKLVGPNEKVLYLPLVDASIVSAGKLYDTWTDEDGELAYKPYEKVYTAYWTGEIATSTEAQNNNQYAIQMLYVEHAKDAVKAVTGLAKEEAVYYNRSRMVGSAIRPVKTGGGTPVASYVDITGKWAQCDASGNALALSEAPQYLSFEGTNYNGTVINVVYGSQYAEYTYSRNINELTLAAGETTMTCTVAEVSADASTGIRVISLVRDGQTLYFTNKNAESPAVAATALVGKWDVYDNGTSTSTVLNILDGSNAQVINGTTKESVTYTYRFGTFTIASTPLTGTYGVEAATASASDDAPFKFVNSTSTLTFKVHPKTYTTLATWNGVSASALPTWLTLGSKNSLTTDIKAVTDINGSAYTCAVKFNASWPSTSNAFADCVGTLTIDGGFKTGDRIVVRGYTNADGKTGGLKVWADKDTQLGTTAPAINDFKAGETVMNKESIFTFTADAAKVYLSREAGTGTFITDITIQRESDE